MFSVIAATDSSAAVDLVTDALTSTSTTLGTLVAAGAAAIVGIVVLSTLGLKYGPGLVKKLLNRGQG